MNVEIFENMDEFNNRPDKSINGVTKEFLDDYNLTLSVYNEVYSETLTGCFNCFDCDELEDCYFCTRCENSKNLHVSIDCSDMENCTNMEDSVGCVNCKDLTDAAHVDGNDL